MNFTMPAVESQTNAVVESERTNWFALVSGAPDARAVKPAVPDDVGSV